MQQIGKFRIGELGDPKIQFWIGACFSLKFLYKNGDLEVRNHTNQKGLTNHDHKRLWARTPYSFYKTDDVEKIWHFGIFEFDGCFETQCQKQNETGANCKPRAWMSFLSIQNPGMGPVQTNIEIRKLLFHIKTKEDPHWRPNIQINVQEWTKGDSYRQLGSPFQPADHN